jgi:hypothetical protein
MGNVTATNTYAAVFNGDVQINGDLSFSGALSIGKLTAYASQAVVDGGFNPTSIHQMVSAPTVAANATINNADTIGMNTAMLLTVGANATVTTNLLGLSALALPAVVSMAAGSTVDVVAGATFAVNLDAGAGGGTITELPLCQSLGIPNGITTVTDCYGYYMDMPFGLIGTNNYGIYVNADINNYFKGNLVIGSTDLPTNSSVGLELVSTTKAFLNARMTTTQRDALTAVNGMMIYNTSTDKLQVRAAGSWVDLH